MDYLLWPPGTVDRSTPSAKNESPWKKMMYQLAGLSSTSDSSDRFERQQAKANQGWGTTQGAKSWQPTMQTAQPNPFALTPFQSRLQ